MNYTLIFLGVIILILLYVLYYYNNSGLTSVLSSKANLNSTVPPITSINSPTNTRYAYGIWVFVNSWNSNSEKVIFSRNNNIRLRLDNAKPTLYCEVTMNDGTTIHRTTITDNFPLQKWVFVIVSVDNQFLDCYLDGKLVKSTRLYQYKGSKGERKEGFEEAYRSTWSKRREGSSGAPQPGAPSQPSSSSSEQPSSSSQQPSSSSEQPSSSSQQPSDSNPATPPSASTTKNAILIPAVPPSETTPIILGGTKPFDAVVSSFTRWSSPVDPQIAWTAYTGGNANSGIGKLSNLAAYSANLSILQNNSEYSKITLF